MGLKFMKLLGLNGKRYGQAWISRLGFLSELGGWRISINQLSLSATGFASRSRSYEDQDWSQNSSGITISRNRKNTIVLESAGSSASSVFSAMGDADSGLLPAIALSAEEIGWLWQHLIGI